jgi:hypothetical protein
MVTILFHGDTLTLIIAECSLRLPSSFWTAHRVRLRGAGKFVKLLILGFCMTPLSLSCDGLHGLGEVGLTNFLNRARVLHSLAICLQVALLFIIFKSWIILTS